jgi:hypothetical protein
LSFQVKDLTPNANYAYRYRAKNALADVCDELAATFMTAEVRLEKTSDASAIGTDPLHPGRDLGPGVFTVSRADTASNLPLTVHYRQTGGTAVTGKNFAALSGSVIIPPGAAKAAIAVTPVADWPTAHDTTLEITLSPGGYIVGSQSVASMTIRNTPTPHDALAVGGKAFGDTGRYDYAFDGNTASCPDGGAYLGLDFGAGNEKQITRIRYYPRSDYPGRMNGAKFQGSNDGKTYTDLHTIPAAPPVAWTEVAITNATPCRYARYLSKEHLNVAEIEFYYRVTKTGGK